MRVLSLAVLLAFSMQAQPWRTTIKVEISGPSEFETQLRSYLGRELRALGDVQETEKNPEYVIDVLALEIQNAGDRKLGYAVYVAVSKPIEYVFQLFPDLLKLQENPLLKTYLKGFTEEHYRTMFTWGSSDLDTLGKRIVATVDSKAFEPDRKLYRLLHEK